MAIISKERTFTWEKIKRITSLDIANVFLVLTMVLPFFLFKRAELQSTFYSELTGVICVAVFLLFACFGIKHFLTFNRLTIYLTAIAGYLIFDILINNPIYPSLQWLYIGSLLLSSLVAIVISSLCHEQGYKKVLTVVCYGLMIGAMLQDAVVIFQTLHQDWTVGWINYLDTGQAYSGNIGQRNLLAHYLSWGILASVYLVQQKNLGCITGWAVVIFQAAILGAVNSKTLIIYMLAILLLLVIARVWQKQLPRSIVKMLALTVVFVFIFQAVTLPLISNMQDTLANNTSSIVRLTNNPEYNSRLTEWHKAWIIFLKTPWFGSGWSSYAYQGFMISLDARFADNISGSGIFTHTHNIVLNLLVETGIVGTTIILGGFAYVLMPALTNKWQIETIVILAMIIITTVHSLVEFPLWITHFFLVFIILLTILISTNQPSKSMQIKSSKIKQYSIKILIFFLSLCYLLTAVHLYFLYWQMQKYEFSLDNSKQYRIAAAEKKLEIGKKQPLLKSYVDYHVFFNLKGIGADNIPNTFTQSLYDYSHYIPTRLIGNYYLIKNCKNKGQWNDEDWLYYKHLNNYYKDNLPTFSILLSMTVECAQVRDIVYQHCKQNYTQKSKSPTCSIEQFKARQKK